MCRPTKSAGRDEQGIQPFAPHAFERGVDLIGGVGSEDLDLEPETAGSRFHVPQYGLRNRSFGRIDQDGHASCAGHHSRSNSNRFADKSTARKVMPVKLPPSRARLATRPRLTGSSPTVKTMGIVVVAALAASADNVPPLVAITATWRRTNSLASAGNRSSSL
jgi:hypothetical protein